MDRKAGYVRGISEMTRAKVGAGILLLLFTLGGGVNSAPQETPQKPGVCASIDGAVKGIAGYKDQSPIAEDGEFLRRVMLDLVGYPPNYERCRQFTTDTNPAKRIQVIEDLLATADLPSFGMVSM